MNTKQIVAVFVVAVIVIAAAAVVLSRNNGDDSTPPVSGEVQSGAFYGNVNGDSRVDETDKSVIESIIDGEYTLEDYPLADANLDGVVDQNDLDVVDSVINNEQTTVYVVDATNNAVAVPYPIGNFAVSAGTNMKSIISILGLGDMDNLKGVALDTGDVSDVLDSKLGSALDEGRITCLTEDSRKLTAESLNLLTQNRIDLVFSEESGMSTEAEVVSAIENLGISYLEFNLMNFDDQIMAISSMGILLGCEDEAERYISWSQGVLDAIRESEGDQYGTKTVLCVVMSNSVSGSSSDYYTASEMAGGDNLADWEDSTKKFNEGDNWLLDGKYNADYIFHFRTLVYPDGMSQDDIAKYAGYFEDTYTYQNDGYYLINGSLPLPVRLAVMAETMYGDCFDEGWSQSIFQEYVTEILGADYDVSQSVYIWNA
ncbi:MAG: hypothetical protein A3205_00590 [Methanomassiliicoccales archaeon Mx-03]|nr:MAG: hypothetical protein A3205_00590 [Methanomassiliicoccales archaeon Mx-03]